MKFNFKAPLATFEANFSTQGSAKKFLVKSKSRIKKVCLDSKLLNVNPNNYNYTIH